MKDFVLEVEVKVTKKAVTPKLGLTQRGPYEKNAGTITERRKLHFFGTDAQVATMAENAAKLIQRSWPLATNEPAQATAKVPIVVGSTTATLIGEVHDHGVSTVVTFEYGTTRALGTSVAAAESPLSGDAWTAVSLDRTGLNADTQYYYRIKAVSGGVTVYSNIVTFKTNPAS